MLLLIPSYLYAVRSRVVAQSRNINWMSRELDHFIFGGFLGFVYRRALLISLFALITVFVLQGWQATVASFVANLLFALCIAPIATCHARQILIVINKEK